MSKSSYHLLCGYSLTRGLGVAVYALEGELGVLELVDHGREALIVAVQVGHVQVDDVVDALVLGLGREKVELMAGDCVLGRIPV